MRAIGAGAFIVCVAVAARAGARSPETAEAPPASFALGWVRGDGAEACPAGRDFAREVARRLGRSPFDERSARSIEIAVERDGDTYRTRVNVREPDGHVSGQRLLSSDEGCAALFSATALAVALLIDPDAAQRSEPAASGTVRAPRATSSVVPASTETPVPSAEPTPPPLRARASPPRLPASADTGATPGDEPVRASARGGAASVSVLALATAGLLPDVEPGAALRVQARLAPRWAVAASAAYLTAGTERGGDVAVDVGLTAFSASAVLTLVRGPVVEAGLEAGAWLGALRSAVQTRAPAAAVTATHPGDFLFVAASGGLFARPRLGRTAFLDLRASAVAPLLRRRLEVTTANGPGSVVFSEGPLAFLAGVGLGIDFF